MEIKLADRFAPDSHRHVVMLNDTADQSGLIGLTSEEEGHVHPIIYIPEQPEIKDPVTGQVVQPRQPESIQVLPNTPDGHTHPLASIPNPEEKSFSEKEKRFYREAAVELYKQAKSLDETYFLKDARICEDFYYGGEGHWDRGELNRRRNKSLTTVTINSVQQPIDTLIGFYIQNQTDILFKPIEEGDEATSDLLNEVTKIVTEHTGLNEEKIEVAYDQLIAGRGNFDVSISTLENPEGDIVISHVPYDNIFYGPHRKKNLRDCQAVARHTWYSRAELRSKMKKEDREIVDRLRFFSFDAEYEVGDLYYDGQYLRGDSIYLKGDEWIDEVAKKIKVITVQFKVSEKEDFIIHNSGFVYYVPQGLPDDIKRGLFSLPNFSAFEKDKEKTILAEVACEDILLRLVESPGDMLTVAAAYATKRGKKVKGKIWNVLDISREKNYIRSKAIDIVRTMNGKGYYITPETFQSIQEKESFLQGVSGEGFVVEIQSASNAPIKEEGVGFPVELSNHLSLINAEIKELMGINDEMLGLTGDSTSNKMLQTNQFAGLIGNQYIFEGMSIAMRRLGRILLKLYPYVFTGERVYRMIRNQDRKIPIMIADRKLSDYSQEEIENLWSKIKDSNYDVAIVEAPFSNTKRERDFKSWGTLASQGVPGVDGRILLELSDLPPDQKARAMKYAEESVMANSRLQEQRLNVENEKTQIAATSRESIEMAKLEQKDKVDTAELQLKALELGNKSVRESKKK